MAWDIKTTDEFQAWWAELSDAEHEVITVGVTILEEKGPALGRPRVDTLAKDSKHPNMKELRVQFAASRTEFVLRSTHVRLGSS
jgi:hypothetical protein